MTGDEARLLAAALFELRLLLGAPRAADDPSPEAEAATLAYALHNEALAVLEGRGFDVDAALNRVAAWDKRRGTDAARRLRFALQHAAAMRAQATTGSADD